ncbi:PssE/Cps14G family polysaccharide biosynthesis glycosyltransferase [Proteiniclasticum sp. C24MP]|uniref:PssE/Cps14G family polysaccharide biosynthesis glycosyltransferase n=1 Tax=Proteiniclasticum sp. C24MP TaxID=3374101 RepID=UPI0037542D89
MILVTLGTQIQPFTRLLDLIEKSMIEEEIIVQAGHTSYESSKMEIRGFIDMDEMQSLTEKARIIITHGGTGSIIGGLKKRKTVIACARLKKYSEHLDDHQLEIVSTLSQNGYILELHDNESLDEVMEKVPGFKPKEFISNSTNFNQKLKEKIDSY